MQDELAEAGDQGFGFVGMTVAKTLVGGDEVVAILRRKVQYVPRAALTVLFGVAGLLLATDRVRRQFAGRGGLSHLVGEDGRVDRLDGLPSRTGWRRPFDLPRRFYNPR